MSRCCARIPACASSGVRAHASRQIPLLLTYRAARAGTPAPADEESLWLVQHEVAARAAACLKRSREHLKPTWDDGS
eukprot:COSAG04_NODE_26417_length_295_cov_0.775510_1_plen_76_part_01